MVIISNTFTKQSLFFKIISNDISFYYLLLHKTQVSRRQLLSIYARGKGKGERERERDYSLRKNCKLSVEKAKAVNEYQINKKTVSIHLMMSSLMEVFAKHSND